MRVADRSAVQLLSAVVSLAIKDACLAPIKNERGDYDKPKIDAFTGIEFLFEHSDFYLDLLDIAPDTFRTQLLKQMYSYGKLKDFTERDKKFFKWNYKYWCARNGSSNKHWENYND